MSRNNRKIILIVCLLALFVTSLTLVLSKIGVEDSEEPSRDSNELIIGRNAIYVPDQIPGERITVSVVYLEKPGFVVVHEDKEDNPGAILGQSALLTEGETKNFFLTLNRFAYEGEMLYAMLHIDDGDGSFDLRVDTPAIDEMSGEAITTIFVTSKDFSEPADVQL